MALSSPDLIRFGSEPAVEAGIETDWRMPATGDTASIAEELRHHIRVVERWSAARCRLGELSLSRSSE
ncbi:hypothetical protein [Streptomyces sp. E-15]